MGIGAVALVVRGGARARGRQRGAVVGRRGGAEGKSSYESPYGYAKTWNAALRLVRVDMGMKILEKDDATGYLLFEYRSSEGGTKLTSGSFEFIAGRSPDPSNDVPRGGAAAARCRATTRSCFSSTSRRRCTTSTGSRGIRVSRLRRCRLPPTPGPKAATTTTGA